MATESDLIGNIRSGVDANVRAFAPYGFVILTEGAGGTAGEYYDKLIPLVDSTISATNSLGGDNPSAVEFPAGLVIHGLFEQSTITIASGGSVMAILTEEVS